MLNMTCERACARAIFAVHRMRSRVRVLHAIVHVLHAVKCKLALHICIYPYHHPPGHHDPLRACTVFWISRAGMCTCRAGALNLNFDI